MKKYNITKQQIKNLIQQYFSKHGKQPTVRCSAKALGVSPTVVRSVFGKWNNAIEAAGLRSQKRVGKIHVRCAECESTIVRRSSSINPKSKTFCSNKCAATHNNRGKKHTEETKQKIRASVVESLQWRKIGPHGGGRIAGVRREPRQYHLTCEECCKTFFSVNKKRKTCCQECKNKYTGKKTSLWLSKNRQHVRGPHQPSYMEETFEQWLVQSGMRRGMSGYLKEVYFFNKQTGKNGWADFVFPRKRCIIELDGTHHAKRKHLDQIRDDHLRQRGWKVVRITHREYITRTRVEEIKQLLGFG